MTAHLAVPVRLSLVALLGLALLTGCRSGGGAQATTGAAATPGRPAPAGGAAVSQSRSIGGPAQPGALQVWLTAYAVLPWTDHVNQGGRHTFTVSNRGLRPHSFAVIQFDGDPRALPTSSNLIATGQVKVMGQTEVIDPGREVDVQVDLPPGRYVLTSLFAQDYTDGMAAAFVVGGTPPGTAGPRVSGEDTLGVYLLEYGAFASAAVVKEGETTITVQNLGSHAREFAVIRWRGGEDTLPVQKGTLLLDGLQEVYRFDTLLAGESREVEVSLKRGFAYVVASLASGEYEKGIRTQIRVN
jgi:hypothetical protein